MVRGPEPGSQSAASPGRAQPITVRLPPQRRYRRGGSANQGTAPLSALPAHRVAGGLATPPARVKGRGEHGDTPTLVHVGHNCHMRGTRDCTKSSGRFGRGRAGAEGGGGGDQGPGAGIGVGFWARGGILVPVQPVLGAGHQRVPVPALPLPARHPETQKRRRRDQPGALGFLGRTRRRQIRSPEIRGGHGVLAGTQQSHHGAPQVCSGHGADGGGGAESLRVPAGAGDTCGLQGAPTCARGARRALTPNTPKTTPKSPQKYPKNHPKNIPKSPQKYPKNHPENIPKTIPRISQNCPKIIPKNLPKKNPPKSTQNPKCPQKSQIWDFWG
ncbi:uncharacterized protein LOC134055414 [Cinclus cinclus]|uniref:uncharacterized protein LOC134055414 n=1 Tax=Cinclus cinclus TaxID=127875 RepID=UPI002E15A19A